MRKFKATKFGIPTLVGFVDLGISDFGFPPVRAHRSRWCCEGEEIYCDVPGDGPFTAEKLFYNDERELALRGITLDTPLVELNHKDWP